jgi:hypothetical protein
MQWVLQLNGQTLQGTWRAGSWSGSAQLTRGDDKAAAARQYGQEAADRAMADTGAVVGAHQNPMGSATGVPNGAPTRTQPISPGSAATAPTVRPANPPTGTAGNESPSAITPSSPSAQRGSAGGGSCAPYQQGLDACRSAVSSSAGASACALMEDALRKCQNDIQAEAPRQPVAPPMRLEREICDAMTLKCGQDSGSSDCRAFQDSVRNNGYRCAVSAPSPRTAQSGTNWGACVRASTSGSNAEPALTLTNNCPGMITWRHCVRVSGRSFADTPSGITQPGSSSVYRLRLANGETFEWRHSWCAGQCTPDTPRC